MQGTIEPVYLEVARWMKQQREKHGISQSQLSRLLGFARPTYHLIEHGKQRIHLHTYEQIRNLLDDDKVEQTKAQLAAMTAPRLPTPPIETPPNGKIEWNAIEVGKRLKVEYEAGTKISALADKYGFPRRHIIYALTVAGVDVRKFQTPPQANLHRDGEIVRLYDGGRGRSLKDIGEVYGISSERVRQILDRAGIPRIIQPRGTPPLTDEQKQILADLDAGTSREAVLEKYGYSPQRLRRLLKRVNNEQAN